MKHFYSYATVYKQQIHFVVAQERLLTIESCSS